MIGRIVRGYRRPIHGGRVPCVGHITVGVDINTPNLISSRSSIGLYVKNLAEVLIQANDHRISSAGVVGAIGATCDHIPVGCDRKSLQGHCNNIVDGAGHSHIACGKQLTVIRKLCNESVHAAPRADMQRRLLRSQQDGGATTRIRSVSLASRSNNGREVR